MKCVLISIRPSWCVKIASGKKVVEVRRKRPKLETPFKCYIYCTKGRDSVLTYNRPCRFGSRTYLKAGIICTGNVIGEFVCDKIWNLAPICNAPNNVEEMACLSRDEIVAYLDKHVGFGWHITDLKMYDAPIPIEAFKRPCSAEQPCALCKHAELHQDGFLACENRVFIPPQSWCYVQEVRDA